MAASSRSSRFLLPLTALWLALPALAGGLDWNQWRGPDRDGHAPEFGVVRDWPTEPRSLWRVEVGLGHASPVVDAERVCLHSRLGDEELVSCHSLEDGRRLWQAGYPVDFSPAMGGGHHGAGPKATPALAAGRLYTFGITGVLSAWSAESGELLWRRDFPSEGGEVWPRWGTSSSPLPIDGDVVVQVGRGTGELLRLTGGSGEVVWSVVGDGAAYASPILAALGGERQIVTRTSEALVGVSLDGKELWRERDRSTMFSQSIPTPVVADDLVIISSEGRPLRALRVDRDGGEWRVEEAWSRKDLALDMSSGVAVDDRLCGLSHRRKGQPFCVRVATGETIWVGPARFADHASVVAVPGALLFQLANGELTVVADPAPDFRPLARVAVANSEVWAHPVPLSGGRLLIKSFERLELLAFD